MSEAAPVGYHDGRFVPAASIGWTLDDLGPKVGAIAVERLRTFGGRLHAAGEHFERFSQSCRGLGFEPPLADMAAFAELCEGLLRANAGWIGPGGDASAVVLASPGTDPPRQPLVGKAHGQPTVIARLEPLPISRLASYYRDGVKLFLSSVRNIPASCWPPGLKTRSRLHYHLADREARERLGAGAVGLLLDGDGCVTDTSIAAVLIRRGPRLIAPPVDRVLSGVTQQRLEPAIRRHFELSRECFSYAELAEADELLLLGSTGQIHAASALDLSHSGRPRVDYPGVTGQAYRVLLDEAKALVAFDFEAQAISKDTSS